jgi:uncharacterized protein (TIGR04141 family)
MPTNESARPLTIYLARNGIKPEDLVSASTATKLYNLTIGPNAQATLLIQVPVPKAPDWADFFENHIQLQDFGENSSTSAAMLTQVNGRYFALTFGNGRFLLQSDNFEDRFGLKVALNCIGEGTVRSIDKHSLDHLLRHTREQASREATTSEFGFDIEQDLLKAVTGKPKNARYGERITGSDALHLSVPVGIDGLSGVLAELGDLFLDTGYRRYFPWIDQIAEVSDPSVEEQLHRTLVGKIQGEELNNIWMAVPELIDWDRVRGFRFVSRKRTAEYHDVDLTRFIDSVGGPTAISSDSLRQQRVRCVKHDGQKLREWSAYKCLYAELEDHGETFVLSGGKWYRVKTDFVRETDSAYNRIPDYDGAFPEFADDDEETYLARIAGLDRKRFALMDQQFIYHGGGHSKVEFCDLFTAERDLCHVKQYGQASALSHLFSQGLVSGELFLMDEEFRRKVNEKLPPSHRIHRVRERPDASSFRVVFAIISNRPGALHLPFFSRLNAKHAARRLQAYGFRVAKAKIEVDEIFGKTGKFRPRSERGARRKATVAVAAPATRIGA